MRLVTLNVEQFGCVHEAEIRFGEGLNVLYGPNDLGKSSLAEAIRAVLLLPHTSSAHQQYVPWNTDRPPRVELVFQTGIKQFWRVRKVFGPRGESLLPLAMW